MVADGPRPARAPRAGPSAAETGRARVRRGGRGGGLEGQEPGGPGGPAGRPGGFKRLVRGRAIWCGSLSLSLSLSISLSLSLSLSEYRTSNREAGCTSSTLWSRRYLPPPRHPATSPPLLPPPARDTTRRGEDPCRVGASSARRFVSCQRRRGAPSPCALETTRTAASRQGMAASTRQHRPGPGSRPIGRDGVRTERRSMEHSEAVRHSMRHSIEHLGECPRPQ